MIGDPAIGLPIGGQHKYRRWIPDPDQEVGFAAIDPDELAALERDRAELRALKETLKLLSE
jgi:hypothetical protein